jgi:hypothetical protein
VVEQVSDAMVGRLRLGFMGLWRLFDLMIDNLPGFSCSLSCIVGFGFGVPQLFKLGLAVLFEFVVLALVALSVLLLVFVRH